MSHQKITVHDVSDVLTTVTKPNDRTVIERLIASGGDLLTMATGNGPPEGPIEGATAYLDLTTGAVYVWSDD